MHGNYKFRLSDMIPNAWFYKLKDMASKATATDSNNNSSSSSSSSSKKKKKNKTKKKPLKPKESSSSSSGAASTTYPKQLPTEKVPYNPRKTHYFSRELLRDDNFSLLNLPDQPRESSKQRTSTRRTTSTASAPKRVSSSSSSGCSCRTIIQTKTVGNSPPPILSSPDEGSSTITTEETEAAYSSAVFRPEIIRSDRLLLVTHSSNHMLSSSTPHREKIESDSSSDIVIDVQPQIALPPIVTKKVTKVEGNRFSDAPLKPKLVEEIKYNRKERGIPKENTTAPSRINQRTRSASCHSPGIRLRINSPRIAASRRRSFQQVQGRRRSLSSSSSVSGSRRSLAVVKSSVDPQRDFRESMVEMIVENNLRGSKDLEELLACYLFLNADEYHDLIIKVFKHIWFDLTHQVK